MKILTSLYGDATGGGLAIRITSRGQELELPFKSIAELCWAHYLNNGLYDELRLAGYFLEEQVLKSIRNPAQRVVKFYTDTIWPGPLPDALPLDILGNRRIANAIAQIWKWSNWQAQKQVAVRQAAVVGELILKVVMGEGGPIYLQRIDPENMTDYTLDSRGNVTYIRIDVPTADREGDEVVLRTYTEIWDEERARFWSRARNPGPESEATPVEQLGEPETIIDLGELGIDFVPFSYGRFLDVGADRGVGAYVLVLDKIDEANRLATSLHSRLFRHNAPTWALRSNMTTADGRPIPPPNIGSAATTAGDSFQVDLAGETMIKLPGLASLESLVPNLNYGDMLRVLESHMDELRSDLPELNYSLVTSVSRGQSIATETVRLLMGPAIKSAEEVRGNLEDVLVRAHKMALTIGMAAGLFPDMGTFDEGDLEHGIMARDIFPLSRRESAEIVAAERDAGFPLLTSLRLAGWTMEEIAELEEEIARQKSIDQAGLATALLDAQEGFLAGASTNGLELG